MSREFWDERYDTDTYIFGTAPNVFLASQAGLIRPGMRALSIADGEGRNGVWLAEQGFDPAYGARGMRRFLDEAAKRRRGELH